MLSKAHKEIIKLQILERLLSNSKATTTLKSLLFNFVLVFVPTKPISTIFAIFLMILSFMQTLSLMIFDDNTIQDLLYINFKCTRVVPLILSYKSCTIYFSWCLFVQLLLILYTIFAIIAFIKYPKTITKFCFKFAAPFYWIMIIPINETLYSMFSWSFKTVVI